MAKPVILQFKGGDHTFAPAKLDRSKLYGTRKRLAVDSQGRPCTRAALTTDGTTLITSGMLAQGYFTPDGRWVARGEMVGLDAQGNTVEARPSTLGVAQSVEGPVPPADLLQLEVTSVYLLEPEDPGSALVTALRSGEVYRAPFNYVAGLEVEVAYLVANDEGIFAMVGRPAEVPWAEQGAVFVAEAAQDEDVDDLDFDQL